MKSAYRDLFEVHGDGAWDLDKDSLITFFRQSDDTSAVIGGRQAAVFIALTRLSGHGEAPTPKTTTTKSRPKASTAAKKKKKAEKTKKGNTVNNTNDRGRDLGLTVRIEINLPTDGGQATYDRIFKSLREHLIDE